MASHVAPARPLPPIGAVLLCLERGSTAPYPVTVERHLGRYLFAGGHHQPHLAHGRGQVWLASPEEQAAAAATILAPTLSMGESQWRPPVPPAGPPKPTECW